MSVYVTCVDSHVIRWFSVIRKKHLVNHYIANRQTPHKLDRVCVQRPGDTSRISNQIKSRIIKSSRKPPLLPRRRVLFFILPDTSNSTTGRLAHSLGRVSEAFRDTADSLSQALSRSAHCLAQAAHGGSHGATHAGHGFVDSLTETSEKASCVSRGSVSNGQCEGLRGTRRVGAHA